MEKQIVTRLISLLIGLAFAGPAMAQGHSQQSGGLIELFQPDTPEFSAGDDAPQRGSSATGLSRERLILVNTGTNRLFVTSGGKVIFQASCSTGKGTALTTGGETHVFATPKGDFLVQSKEEHPSWVPPDWYFIEEARKQGLGILRIQPGRPIPLGSDTGFVLASNAGGVGEDRLEVRRATVVRVSGSTVRVLPPGKLIRAVGAIVIPPYGTPQRKFDKVLGAYRINFGGGFGIHGTDEPDKIGRPVTHGCVRLSDADIRALYPLVEVGDEVVIF
jgi:lipoprotein-anchoring transpeptidase ErfK/SrfK